MASACAWHGQSQLQWDGIETTFLKVRLAPHDVQSIRCLQTGLGASLFIRGMRVTCAFPTSMAPVSLSRETSFHVDDEAEQNWSGYDCSRREGSGEGAGAQATPTTVFVAFCLCLLRLLRATGLLSHVETRFRSAACRTHIQTPSLLPSTHCVLSFSLLLSFSLCLFVPFFVTLSLLVSFYLLSLSFFSLSLALPVSLSVSKN